MRISAEAAEEAVRLISAQYPDATGIWLFGSRTDDGQRGGDVDLFVESRSTDVMRRLRCQSALTELFDLKVDFIVGEGDRPVQRIAKSTGIRLR